MTHARNIWVAIALEVIRKNTGWNREDVARYCSVHVIQRSMGYDPFD